MKKLLYTPVTCRRAEMLGLGTAMEIAEQWNGDGVRNIPLELDFDKMSLAAQWLVEHYNEFWTHIDAELRMTPEEYDRMHGVLEEKIKNRRAVFAQDYTRKKMCENVRIKPWGDNWKVGLMMSNKPYIDTPEQFWENEVFELKCKGAIRFIYSGLHGREVFELY